jgi:hypothetical protein
MQGRLSLALLLAVAPGVSHALPDLTPEIYAVFLDTDATVGSGDVAEGCAGATTGRTLLRFGVRSMNVGATALHTGDPGCPDCATNPGAVCDNPLFECSPADGHNHPHFTDFARYELLDPAGQLVAEGGKRSFCMLDTACPGGGTRIYTHCQDQGISPGCYDEYAPTLGCQYVDVTDVPDVTTRAFRLRVTIDPDDLLPDVDRTNNAVEVALPGCGDGIVQDGEECDAGPTSAPSCCDTSCRLVPSGVTCAGGGNACRVPGVCNGASAECAPGGAVADDTPCGAGLLPCIADVCAGGTCIARQVAGCVIDGACRAAGELDPQDACRQCEPARSPDAWSELADATPAGVGCQVGRIATATSDLACPARLMRRVARRVHRLDEMAARLPTVSPAGTARLHKRLARRASRLVHVLEGAADRGRCATDVATIEVRRLRDQVAGA